MERIEFNKGMAILVAAYIYSQEKVNPATEEAYWVVLQDAPAEKFLLAVKECMVECKFFPSIHELVTRMFPPYSIAPPYNPRAVGHTVEVSSFRQLQKCSVANGSAIEGPQRMEGECRGS
jgi:hypothetical protein|tara:strand:+ start:180 stop:539 length:360 start_codon:yes stop_codon:yes gene_type:complete